MWMHVLRTRTRGRTQRPRRRRGRGAAGGAAIVATTLSCLLAAPSGVGGRTCVARARRAAAARHRPGARRGPRVRSALGLVSQAAQHAKARAIPAEATNAALLCESALSRDPATPKRTAAEHPAAWRGRLDACLDDCASLREVVRGTTRARPVVASVRLLRHADPNYVR